MRPAVRRYLRVALIAVAAIAAICAAAVAIEYSGRAFVSFSSHHALAAAGRPGPNATQVVSSAPEAMQFTLHHIPRPVADFRFSDSTGQARSLEAFRGKIVLLNVWATWCAPCRREMPTLDRLQERLGGREFEVLALSIDRAGTKVVESFYRDTGIRHLSIYTDSSANAARALGAVGLPTTVLIDPEGREIGRLVGPAEWDSPEMIFFLKKLLAIRN